MKMIELNLKPETKQLRQFGFISLVAFGVIGGVVVWRNGLFGFDFGEHAKTVAYTMWALGGISGLLSLVAPRLNWPLYVTLIVVTYPIGFVLSYVLMGVLFYGIFTPVAIVFKLMGRDAMHRKFDPDAASYFVPHKPAASKERYFKQF